MAFTNDYLNIIADLIDADVSYLALVADYDSPTSTSEIGDAGVNELGRVVPTTSVSGNRLTISASFDTSTANCLNTTISGVTSTTVFDLTSVTGLTVGDRIEIVLSTGSEQRKISNIATNTITIDKALSSTPAGSEVVKQYISGFYLVTGGSASANSGTTIFADSFIKFKDSDEPQLEFSQAINILGN
jgi:hypothetical protein